MWIPEIQAMEDIAHPWYIDGNGTVWNSDVNNGFPDLVLIQPTGLKDKIKVEIFEGDILSGVDGKLNKYIGQVKYKPEWGRIVIDEANLTLTYGIANRSRIVGNIYENPELLNGD